MYDLNKRAYFSYLGELRMLLAEMPDDTEVCTGGVLGSYLHFSKERNLVSFDGEDLSPDAYEELEDDDGTLSAIAESREYDECSIREQWLEAGDRYLICGDKLLRTFLADDGSWDYELSAIRLSVVDSGQLGENNSMTREEVIHEVLMQNELDHNAAYPLSPIVLSGLRDAN